MFSRDSDPVLSDKNKHELVHEHEKREQKLIKGDMTKLMGDAKLLAKNPIKISFFESHDNNYQQNSSSLHPEAFKPDRMFSRKMDKSLIHATHEEIRKLKSDASKLTNDKLHADVRNPERGHEKAVVDGVQVF